MIHNGYFKLGEKPRKQKLNATNPSKIKPQKTVSEAMAFGELPLSLPSEPRQNVLSMHCLKKLN